MVEDAGSAAGAAGSSSGRAERKPVLLRLDPAVHEALTRWAADDLRSLNAHVELLLRQALGRAGRAPRPAGPLPTRGRPAKPDVPGGNTARNRTGYPDDS
jgi:hypothetical protein